MRNNYIEAYFTKEAMRNRLSQNVSHSAIIWL